MVDIEAALKREERNYMDAVAVLNNAVPLLRNGMWEDNV